MCAEERSQVERLAENRRRLRARLGEYIKPSPSDRSEEAFNELALAVFRHQAEANLVYGNFVRHRGIDPAQLGDWRLIPAVPARAFKELQLVCQGAGPVQATFRTSGTSQGARNRGVHEVCDLSLYRASLLASAAQHLRGGSQDSHDVGMSASTASAPCRVLALLPSPEDRPDSSLVFMAGALMDAWDDGGGGFFVGADWSIDQRRLMGSLEGAAADRIPVLLLGTAFAYVHWLDETMGTSVPRMPSGSVLMETGGYKGRSRIVPREELYRDLSRSFGIPAGRIVNEYGMTELLSQFYEPVLREGDVASPGERRHVGPPWVRTRVLDPSTLDALPPGRPGLLWHLDLANLDSVAAILTEDWGVAIDDGFRILGRAPGAEPRGCSLTMDALLEASGEGPS